MKYTRFIPHLLAFFLILTAAVVVSYTYGNLSQVFAGTYSNSPADFSYAGNLVFGTPPTNGGSPAGDFLEEYPTHTNSSYQVGDITFCERACNSAGYKTCNLQVVSYPDGHEDVTGQAYVDECYGYSKTPGGTLSNSPTYCGTAGGTCFQNLAIYAVNATLTTSKTTIASGQSAVLTWGSVFGSADPTGSAVCTGSGFSTGGAPSGSITVSPTTTTTYGVTCVGGAHDDRATKTANVTVTVTGSSAPVATLTVSPATITSGGSTNVKWTCTNSNYARITNSTYTNMGTQTAMSGTLPDSPTVSGVYTLQCTDKASGQTDTDTAPITVNGTGVGGTCSVSPTSADTGETVTWSATPSGGNGTYTYSWTGTDGLSGSSKNVSKSYSSAGTKSASVTITSNGSSKTVACSNSVNISSNAAPNLTAGAIRPTAYVAGQSSVSIFATVTNNGNLASGGPFTTKFQRAIDSRGTNFSSIGFDTLTNVPAGTSKDVSIPNPFTTDDAGSTIYVRACADASNDVNSESNEGDNCGPWTKVTVLAAACSVSPTTANVGDSVTWTANPTGGAGAGTYTYSWAGTDTLTGTGKTVAKAYSTTGVKTANVTITSGGVSAYAACSNSVTVGPAAIPDLTTGAVSPTTVSTGVLTPLSATVTNQGTASTVTTFRNVLQVASDINGTIGVKGIGTQTMANPLDAKGTVVTSISYATTTTDVYFARICADSGGQIDEGAQEGNNCGPWTQINVGAPDFIGNPTTASNGKVGDTIAFASTIYNGGSISGGNIPNVFQIKDPQEYIGANTINVLGVGVTKDINGSKRFDTAGTYKVRACVNMDSNGVIVDPEQSTGYGNNCGDWTTFVISNPVAPTCSLSANPLMIAPGGTTNITWSSTNATSCTGSGFSTGGATSGTKTDAPATLPISYGLHCNGAGSTSCDAVPVTVGPSCTAAPTLAAAPTRVKSGSPFTLTWGGTAGVSGSCTITGTDGYSNTIAPGVCLAMNGTGSRSITTQTTYTITCDGKSASVTVNVLPKFLEF